MNQISIKAKDLEKNTNPKDISLSDKEYTNYQNDLIKQGYRFSGNHSAVKVCEWTKKSLRGQGTCYKEKFYGINCHRCIQSSVSVNFCNLNCVFCWRDQKNYKYEKILDNPDKIIEESIKGQIKLLEGFRGNKNLTENSKAMQKVDESLVPMHFAISLTGETYSYPKISELLDKMHEKGFSTFIVTNGMYPEIMKKTTSPTQLYVSLSAPNKELFNLIDRPMGTNGWEKLMKSMEYLNELKNKTRTTIRVTLIRDINMIEPENYAKIINKANPMFIEVKAYMWLGASRERLNLKNMPTHEEVKDFAKEICKHSGYKIIDEQKESKVILLMKEDTADRFLKFDEEKIKNYVSTISKY